MRILLKATLPVETANATIADGSFSATLKNILQDLNPEAAYFTEENGHRTAFLFLHVQDAAHIPHVSEPFFHAFHAKVELHPAMNADDLAKAAPELQKAATKYASKYSTHAV